jgi:hypothetical protein
LNAAEFAELQIAHRLGGWGDFRPSLSDAARNHTVSVSSVGTLAWDAGNGLPYPVNGWTGRVGAPHKLRTPQPGVKVYKFRDTLRSMLASGLDFDAVIDMQDWRVRSLAGPDNTLFPTVCFNRVLNARGRVLWHMPGPLHEIGADQFLGPFPDPDALPFALRARRLVWRGGVTGRANTGDDVVKETYRFQKIFALVAAGKRDMAWAADRLEEFPRYRFARHMAHDPIGDVAFVEQTNLHPLSKPLMQPLQGPSLSPREQARSKYIAVVRGADLASSFYWTMNSGSLGLVMESPWESFGSVHFRPWQHYVPFRMDLSDLAERLEWCDAHPAECATMVQAAGEVCRLLARHDLRIEIDHAVVEGLRQLLQQGRYGDIDKAAAGSGFEHLHQYGGAGADQRRQSGSVVVETPRQGVV